MCVFGGVYMCAFVYIKYFWKVHKLVTWVASEDLNGYKMLAERRYLLENLVTFEVEPCK